MQRWFVSLALAAVLSIVLAGAVSAQVQIQVQAQPAQAQAQAAQVQGGVQIQIQVQPGNVQVIQADRVAVMPGMMYNQNRLLQADAIFVGRVVAMEPMDIQAASAPGGANVTYRIAVVEITEVLHGLAKDTKMARVGFIAQPNNGPNVPAIGGVQILPAPGQPAIQPFPGRRPFGGPVQINLTVGQNGMFALTKHHKEAFFLAPNSTNFVTRDNNPNFDNELKTAKQMSKALANPVAALKADDKQDRYIAAAILISKYRSNPTGVPMKNEPIDAAESKLILQALAAGDWTVGRFNAAVPNPFELFGQLGITPKDGYNPVIRNQQDQATAMQKWLDENNGKYVIQKLVADPNAKAAPIGIDPAQPLPPVVRPPIKLNPKVKVQPPIKGGVRILPAPVPQPLPIAPIEIEVAPPVPAPLPIRRDDK